jgi:hypothetical protein
MKFIEDIVSAVQGNTKEKLNDPVIGSFVASFIVCNWQHVLVLIFGNEKIEERITDFVTGIEPIGVGWDWLLSFSGIYLLPLLMALSYVIVMPWVSIGISKLVRRAALGKHSQAVDLEIEQVEKQQELNKQKLLSDPNKEFLSQIVKNDIKQKDLETEKKQAGADKAKDDAKKAKADREAAEAISNKAKKEDDLQKTKNENEKKKLSVGVAVTNSMLQANAYYSSLNFVRLLSENLAEDSIAITHKSLTEIIAAVFGYKNFDDLLGDSEFNNKALSELKYILLDSTELGRRLEEILSNDFIDDDVCSVGQVADHLATMFDSLPYLHGDEDAILEAVYDELEREAYSLIHTDEVSSAIAETDTIIEDIELTSKSVARVKKGLVITIGGFGSGSHRKESDIRGQGIDLKIEILLPVKWGIYGLGKSTMDITASPEIFDDEWGEPEAEIEE